MLVTPGQVVLFVIGTIIIIVGAYYVTYYVGVKSVKVRRGAGRSIVLRDRFAISRDKSFCLVEVCGKVYVVGITNQTITLLDTLTAEELEQDEAERERQGYQSVGLQSMITGGLADFLARFMKKPSEKDARNSHQGGSFAEKLKKAEADSDATAKKQERRVQETDSTQNPEGEE